METPRMQKLSEIEKKIELILKSNKLDYKPIDKREKGEELNKVVDNDNQSLEQNNDDNVETMLKDLTAQILDKAEVQNLYIKKDFKLDQIQLNDKPNEYKNLLRAMGALYFSNKYKLIMVSLLRHWRERLNEKIQAQANEEVEIQENQVVKNVMSEPGLIGTALQREIGEINEEELQSKYYIYK